MLQDISKSSGQKFNFQNCLKSTWDCINIALEGVFMILKTKFYKKSFIFSFVDLALFYEIWPFSLLQTHCWPKKFIIRPYFKKYGKSEKSKTTLFSQTFKVWENKVPLVLSILPYFLRYGHFKIFSIFLLLGVQNRNSFHGKLTIPFSNIIIFSYFWVSLLSWKIISF